MMRPADAALAGALGAWRLGVVFAGGPRTVSVDLARAIVHAAGTVPVVGVYQSQDVRTILQISEVTGLQGAQLHGEYSSEAAGELRAHGLEVWRVAPIAPDQLVAGQVTRWLGNVDVLLIEPRHHDGRGGKGVALDLRRAREARREAAPVRVALAGGLTPQSVRAAIRFVGPEIVDVSSGVESAPGIKDPVMMARFLEQVRDAYPRA